MIIYRRFEISDIPEVIKIQREAYEELGSRLAIPSDTELEKVFTAMASNPSIVNIVAETNKRIIGLCQFSVNGKLLELNHWFVSKEFRRTNCGIRLFEIAEEVAANFNISVFIVNISAASSEAVETFLKRKKMTLMSKQFIRNIGDN